MKKRLSLPIIALSAIGAILLVSIAIFVLFPLMKDATAQGTGVFASSPLGNPYPNAVKVELVAGQVEFKTPTSKPKLREQARHLLTADERQAFEALLFHTEYDTSEPVVICGYPQHFFRYYDAANKQVGEVAVNFETHQVAVNPLEMTLAANEKVTFKYDELKALVIGMGVPIDPHC